MAYTELHAQTGCKHCKRSELSAERPWPSAAGRLLHPRRPHRILPSSSDCNCGEARRLEATQVLMLVLRDVFTSASTPKTLRDPFGLPDPVRLADLNVSARLRRATVGKTADCKVVASSGQSKERTKRRMGAATDSSSSPETLLQSWSLAQESLARPTWTLQEHLRGSSPARMTFQKQGHTHTHTHARTRATCLMTCMRAAILIEDLGDGVERYTHTRCPNTRGSGVRKPFKEKARIRKRSCVSSRQGEHDSRHETETKGQGNENKKPRRRSESAALASRMSSLQPAVESSTSNAQ